MRIKWPTLVLIIVFLVFFYGQYQALSRQFHSFNFGDEGEHLTLGWAMVRWNKGLYTDLSTNHQPISFLVSGLLFKTLKPANLFMLIQRSRQLMWLFSFLGALILSLRFKKKGLITVILVELVKFYFFGFHILAESLVVYPVLFIAGLVLEKADWVKKKTRSWNLIDDYVFGLCLFIGFFSLLPLAPFLLISSIIYLWKRKAVSVFRVFIGAGLPTLVLFMFINPRAWFEETVVNVVNYVLPFETQNTAGNNLRLLFYPFLSFLKLNNIVSRTYALLTIGTGLFLAIIYSASKHKLKTGGKICLFYLWLLSLNLRTPDIDISFYRAFHVLPQVVVFVFLLVVLSFDVVSLVGKGKGRGMVKLASVILFLALVFNSWQWWFEKKDNVNEFFIQYGEAESVGTAIKAIGYPGDFLLAGVEGYINIVADVPLATRQNSFLNWSFRSDKLRLEFIDVMENEPPTFIYFPKSSIAHYVYLEPILQKQYSQLKRLDESLTHIYMLKSQIPKRTEDKWLAFEALYFKRP